MNKLPNIVLLGVGHSGTTVVAEMMKRFGWVVPDISNKDYAVRNESEFMVKINRKLVDHLREIKVLDFKIDIPKLQEKTRKICKELPNSYVLKDPRLVLTLQWWYKSFAPLDIEQPKLIYLTRDRNRLIHSFKKRGRVKKDTDIASNGLSVDGLIKAAGNQYNMWGGDKIKISYEQILDGISIFNIDRNNTDNKDVGKIGV